MIGEFEFESHFTFSEVKSSGSNGSVQLLFVSFLLLGTLTVSNLLMALTVNKTEELSKKAEIIRLEKTVCIRHKKYI